MAWNYNNPYMNNSNLYGQQNSYTYSQQQQMPQRYSITRVNGENGAKSIQMMPNSEALLLDTTQPIVWLAQTDGAGYLTVTAFDIAQHVDLPPVDVRSLEQRLAKLEGIINGKSDIAETNTGVVKAE